MRPIGDSVGGRVVHEEDLAMVGGGERGWGRRGGGRRKTEKGNYGLRKFITAYFKDCAFCNDIFQRKKLGSGISQKWELCSIMYLRSRNFERPSTTLYSTDMIFYLVTGPTVKRE